MATLVMFVDYDNVERGLTRAGPVAFAKTLATLVPPDVLARHDSLVARLYGGWRMQGNLTTAAQRLVPDIRAGSPAMVGNSHVGFAARTRLSVELADRPIWSSRPLEETFVRNRELRAFRARERGWAACTSPNACGLNQFISLSHRTTCATPGCLSCLADVFVRDEQKMVDTMIVADIAHQVLNGRATDIVVVSSDTDMWPGVLLAVQAKCRVTHVHTRAAWRTQRHLLNTLDLSASSYYQQLSV